MKKRFLSEEILCARSARGCANAPHANASCRECNCILVLVRNGQLGTRPTRRQRIRRCPVRAADRCGMAGRPGGDHGGLRCDGLTPTAGLDRGRLPAPPARRPAARASPRRPAGPWTTSPWTDRASGPSKGGHVGPSSVCRARPGSKHHLIVDRHGTPLAVTDAASPTAADWSRCAEWSSALLPGCTSSTAPHPVRTMRRRSPPGPARTDLQPHMPPPPTNLTLSDQWATRNHPGLTSCRSGCSDRTADHSSSSVTSTVSGRLSP